MQKPSRAEYFAGRSSLPQEDATTAQAIQVNVSSTDHSEISTNLGNDKELFIRKAIEQNARQGCELLFKQYYPFLCSHAIRFVYSRQVAEDIVAEVFANFWHQQVYLSFQGPFRSYLFRAVRNRVINYLRWELNKTQRLDSDTHSASESVQVPDQILQIDELHLKVEQIIADLPPQQRKVFLLSRFEGKKYAEIARELNISVKAVEAHVSKALAVFRKKLKGLID